MRIQKKNTNAAAYAASELEQGNVVILPTDTIYGFSGLIGKTADKIAALKGRNENKPFIVLIAEPTDIYRYTALHIADRIMNLWPAPLTLIVPLKEGGTQAFRCPADSWLRTVIAGAGDAIYSTSVNRTGAPPLSDIDIICSQFEDSVALVVDDGALQGIPSTIIDLCCDSPRVLRQGSIRIENRPVR